MADRLLPTGTCWCGCGTETARGAFFAVNHDRIAEAAEGRSQHCLHSRKVLHGIQSIIQAYLSRRKVIASPVCTAYLAIWRSPNRTLLKTLAAGFPTGPTPLGV